MKKIIISVVIFLLSMSSITPAETMSPNKDLLEEIDIMETVLTRIMGKDNNVMAFRNTNANGFYLPGYGVIFNVAYSEDSDVALAPPVPVVEFNRITTQDNDVENKRKDVINDVKKILIKFFTKYASSISSIKPDEKITVITDLYGFSFIPSARKNKSPQQVTATLSVSDLTDYKRNRISGDELEKHINFNEVESVDQDVSIFSNIIKTSLGYMKEESGFGFHGDVKNIQVKGLGILFMVDADFGMKTFQLLNKNLEDLEKNLKVMEENIKEKEKGKVVNTRNIKIVKKSKVKPDDVKEYEEKLINVISKYGHTLSKIKPNEYVEIALNFNGVRMDKDFSKGILKIKKSDIDDFYKGKIDYESFSKKASMIYY